MLVPIPPISNTVAPVSRLFDAPSTVPQLGGAPAPILVEETLSAPFAAKPMVFALMLSVSAISLRVNTPLVLVTVIVMVVCIVPLDKTTFGLIDLVTVCACAVPRVPSSNVAARVAAIFRPDQRFLNEANHCVIFACCFISLPYTF